LGIGRYLGCNPREEEWGAGKNGTGKQGQVIQFSELAFASGDMFILVRAFWIPL
jgi:hypothetical protein